MSKTMKGVTHKKDIKLVCPIRNLGSAVNIHGFESYERDVDSQGKAVKRLIPNVALQFLPGDDNIENGFTVAYVSRTENNLKVIQDLMKHGIVICDDPTVEAMAEAASVAAVEPLAAGPVEAAKLLEKSKQELFEMAAQCGVAVDSTMTKKTIVEAIMKASAPEA